MPKLLQVRNVPDRVHRRLKVRAAEEGRTLSDYVLRELERIAERPTRAEWLERLRSLPPVELPPGAAAEAVSAGRAEREAAAEALRRD